MAGWCEIFIADQLPFLKMVDFNPQLSGYIFCSNLQFTQHMWRGEISPTASLRIQSTPATIHSTYIFFNTYKMLDLSFVYLLIRELITSLQFLYCVFRHCCLWILGNWERSFQLSQGYLQGRECWYNCVLVSVCEKQFRQQPDLKFLANSKDCITTPKCQLFPRRDRPILVQWGFSVSI